MKIPTISIHWKQQDLEILTMHSSHKNKRVYPGKPNLGRKPNNLSIEEFRPRYYQYITINRKIPYREYPPQG
jgi:hypothetical protein